MTPLILSQPDVAGGVGGRRKIETVVKNDRPAGKNQQIMNNSARRG